MEESPFLTTSADAEGLETRPLYGGAITMAYPRTYTDVSGFRAVPDHQEVWVEGKQGAGDDSVIVELLNLKDDATTEDELGGSFGIWRRPAAPRARHWRPDQKLAWLIFAQR